MKPLTIQKKSCPPSTFFFVPHALCGVSRPVIQSQSAGSTERRCSAGFTLIETMVSISILVIALIGPMTIAARGLQSAYYAKDELTAVYLAQEGSELVRAKRDGYALNYANVNRSNPVPGAWTTDSTLALCLGASGCGLDAINTAINTATKDCTTVANCKLNYDSNGAARAYTYSTIGGTISASPFTRVIQISGNPAETIVTVTVNWPSGFFATHPPVVLQSRIFNHYDSY